MRVALFLAALTACSGSGRGGGGPRARPSPEPITDARLARGAAPAFGCFAWSSTLRAAACIAGQHVGGKRSLLLAFVDGHSTAMKLDEPIDDATARAANDALSKGRYEPLVVDPKPFALGEKIAVGRATLEFRSWRATPPQGVPTTVFQVHALCDGDDSNVIGFNNEKGTVSFSQRSVEHFAILEYTIEHVRDGLPSRDVSAVVYDGKECKTLGYFDDEEDPATPPSR